MSQTVRPSDAAHCSQPSPPLATTITVPPDLNSAAPVLPQTANLTVADAAGAAQAPTRRRVLRHAAAATLAAAALSALSARPAALAQDDPTASDDPPPAMRSAQGAITQSAADAPIAPAPEIIALNRMAFGPRPGELDAMVALGGNSQARVAAYIEQQLNPAGIDDGACDAVLAGLGLTTLAKPLPQLFQDHVRKPNLPWDERMRPALETRTATVLRALHSKRQLVEVLADFWHNHFNVYGFDFWSGTTWVHYDRDVIRANALGNFRTMLEAVATSPAMLYYLDNISNTSAGPNENFARELFELHTMGAMNYLGVVKDPNAVPKDAEGRPVGYHDGDVYGATRSFTGWRVDEDTGAFAFDDAVHDKYSKNVLGVYIDNFLGVGDGRLVLDTLANHPGTARHIAYKLCRRLIGDQPPQSVVDAAAATFYAQRSAPDQLKQVVRTILVSPEFSTTWGQKIKRPFEYLMSLLRAANAAIVPDDSFFWVYSRTGQPLFQWQPPNGFPDIKEDWSSTMPMLQRWRLCNWLVDGWRVGGDGPDKDDLRMPLDNQMPASLTTPTAIVDYWALRILGRPLPADERTPIIEFMAHGRNPTHDLPADEITDRLRFMVGLIFMSPSFQWR